MLRRKSAYDIEVVRGEISSFAHESSLNVFSFVLDVKGSGFDKRLGGT